MLSNELKTYIDKEQILNIKKYYNADYKNRHNDMGEGYIYAIDNNKLKVIDVLKEKFLKGLKYNDFLSYYLQQTNENELIRISELFAKNDIGPFYLKSAEILKLIIENKLPLTIKKRNIIMGDTTYIKSSLLKEMAESIFDKENILIDLGKIKKTNTDLYYYIIDIIVWLYRGIHSKRFHSGLNSTYHFINDYLVNCPTAKDDWASFHNDQA